MTREHLTMHNNFRGPSSRNNVTREHFTDPLWLGAQHVGGKFLWEDDSPWDYDNWYSGGIWQVAGGRWQV